MSLLPSAVRSDPTLGRSIVRKSSSKSVSGIAHNDSVAANFTMKRGHSDPTPRRMQERPRGLRSRSRKCITRESVWSLCWYLLSPAPVQSSDRDVLGAQGQGKRSVYTRKYRLGKNFKSRRTQKFFGQTWETSSLR